MSLKKLMDKKSLTILGLNSGTSADGLDMAVVKVSRQGKKIKISFISGQNKKYPDELRTRILKLADTTTTSLEEIISLDNAVGSFFGSASKNFLNRLSKTNFIIDAVASHGQTVRHVPIGKKPKQDKGTLQIGSLEQISTKVQRVTVGDFRQADIAIGNEGAPITVAAMHRMFASPNETRLIVNIGGISNFFYFTKSKSDKKVLAGDCGPGNVLCDILSQRLFKKNFDTNGSIANKGKPSKRILSLLLAEPFFKSKLVSTGRETFGKEFADRIMKFGKKFNLTNADIVSTAAELTVMAIINRIKPLIKQDRTIVKLYLTGGGRKNKFFVKRLKENLDNIEIMSADKLGINADYIEAASYAVMGEAALRSEPLQTLFTGKKTTKQLPVLGKIVQPPVKK